MSSMQMCRIVASLAVATSLVGCSSSADESSPTGSSATVDSVVGDSPTDSTPAPSSEPAPIDDIVSGFVGDIDGGVDVIIERGGDVQRSTVGIATSDGAALEEGQPFRVGSISKPFVAVMVLQLVDEGAIDLDTPLGTYLPDVAVGADATIRQLLSHQSGIPNYTDQRSFLPDVIAEPDRQFTQAEILAYVSDVDSGPIDEFAYSNTNYVLLGQLIEELDGNDLNTSLHTRITEPVGLTDTFFDTGDVELPDDLAGGWSPLVGDGGPGGPYGAISSSAWAAGALVSTVDDLALFLDALASGGLISAASFIEMSDFGPAGYGLGLLQVGFSATQRAVGHNGSIPGYHSTMAIDPDTGDFLVVLTSNDRLVADQLAAEILTAQS